MISVMLFSCAKKKKEDEKILAAEVMYNQSMDNLQGKKYKKAIEGFEDLERTYPYSKWAIKAQIMSAYTSFKNEQYTDAIVTLDKFISLHPGNRDIEYAYYLKAICYYEQISDIQREQSYTILARDALKEVIARFPNSNYARDAQGKLDLVMDNLAGKEVEVGRFYLKNKKYIAAINRFKEVVEHYQTTSYTPEALHRLVEANTALGLKDQAYKYASVLGYNYPGSKWYAYSYKLIDGQKPDVVPQKGVMGRALGFMKSPFDILKNQPNLVDSVDKNVGNIGDEKPVKVQPTSRRGVNVEDIKPVTIMEENNGNHKKGNLVDWLKNLRVPFTGSKD